MSTTSVVSYWIGENIYIFCLLSSSLMQMIDLVHCSIPAVQAMVHWLPGPGLHTAGQVSRVPAPTQTRSRSRPLIGQR